MKQRLLRAWPLWSILAVQLVLTMPWLWRTAPFTDEALYLEAGRKLLMHWMHRSAVPDYASWFSGAPVLYPPLGAAANAAGGLIGARMLSLFLMLGSTTLVYLTGRRLFGSSAAIFGSGIFAVSGLMVHYGAFATYNPMALFFITLGLWAAVRCQDGGGYWIIVCIVALVTANAAKFGTTAWDPVVAGISMLHGSNKSAKRALSRVAFLTCGVLLLEAALLALGGRHYLDGLISTTLNRKVQWGYSSPLSVFWRALVDSGLLMFPGVFGIVASIARKNSVRVTLMIGVLVLAGIVDPVDQARIHELSALDKNIGFGFPFIAIAAGYGIAIGIEWAGEHLPAGSVTASIAGGALVVLVLIAGRQQSIQFRGPNIKVAAQLVSAIRRGYRPGSHILVDGAPWMEKYYLSSIPSQAWRGIFDPSPPQRQRIRKRICEGQISVVMLRTIGHSYFRPYDQQVYKMLNRSQHYRLVLATSQGKHGTQVWQDERSRGKKTCNLS